MHGRSAVLFIVADSVWERTPRFPHAVFLRDPFEARPLVALWVGPAEEVAPRLDRLGQLPHDGVPSLCGFEKAYFGT